MRKALCVNTQFTHHQRNWQTRSTCTQIRHQRTNTTKWCNRRYNALVSTSNKRNQSHSIFIRSFFSNIHRLEAPNSQLLGGSSLVLNDNEKELLSYIDHETKVTEEQIDGLLSNVDVKHKISRSIIEKEIFDAASLIADSEPETGPTGKYIYKFEDDLNVGKRIYSRIPYVLLGTGGINDDDDVEKQPIVQKVFEINLQMEYLGPMSLSTDERYAVRMVIHTHLSGMKPQIIVTDIDTGREYKMSNASHHNFHNVEFGPKYTIGSKTWHSLFFTITNETGRPFAVHACAFDGESFSTMRVMYKDKNPANLVDVQRTKGCEYVAISSSSKMDNEIRIVGGDFDEKAILRDSSKKLPWKPKLVKKRERGVQYYVDCGNKGDVIILAHRSQQTDNNDTNLLSNEMSVFEAKTDMLPLPLKEFGKPLHQHNSKDSIHFVEDIALFQDYLVLFERSSIDSTQQIRVIDRTTENSSIVSLGFRGAKHKQITPCGNIQYDSKSFKFDVETPLTPAVNHVYDFSSGTLTSSPYSIENDNIESERVFVSSDDGTKIPLSMYYDKTVPTRGVILIGYGSYGQNQNLSYDPALAPLIKRGFVMSYCHGRGGGDLGKCWYEAGRLYNKENAINDYISCAKAIAGDIVKIPNTQENDTIFLGAKAFSAGGVVVSAALNKEQCKLFQAVSLLNPFLNVMGTMAKYDVSSSDDYLIEHEYDEFGNPINDDKAFSSIQSYCPVLNIKDSISYPPMLVVSTLDDENVPFHHGILYTSKIREGMKDEEKGNVLLHIEKVGGHHLHGRRLDVCTLENCFLLGHLYGGEVDNE